MAWLCVDKDSTEIISPSQPIRDYDRWNCCYENVEGWYDNYGIILTKGTIKKIIGRDLKWEDEPIEI